MGHPFVHTQQVLGASLYAHTIRPCGTIALCTPNWLWAIALCAHQKALWHIRAPPSTAQAPAALASRAQVHLSTNEKQNGTHGALASRAQVHLSTNEKQNMPWNLQLLHQSRPAACSLSPSACSSGACKGKPHKHAHAHTSMHARTHTQTISSQASHHTYSPYVLCLHFPNMLMQHPTPRHTIPHHAHATSHTTMLMQHPTLRRTILHHATPSHTMLMQHPTPRRTGPPACRRC